MIHANINVQRTFQTDSAAPPSSNINKKPDHVNDLLWNLSTPQERAELLNISAPLNIQYPQKPPPRNAKKQH